MKVKGGIFVYAQDIMTIKGVSMRSAVREIRLIRDAFDKQSKEITVFDCSKYWDITIDEMVKLINDIR